MGFKYFYIKENESEFDFEYFKSLDRFSIAKKYISGKLKRIGAGSSREVYEYGDKAIKVAKNSKGIAQNSVEGDYGLHRMYEDILPKLYDKHDEDIWILVERADKITKLEFKKLAGISFEDFCVAISSESMRLRGKSYKDVTEFLENPFTESVVSMMVNFDMLHGDFMKLNTFGKIGNRVVVVDPGFTNEVYKTHYR